MLYSVSDMFQYFLTQVGTTEDNALSTSVCPRSLDQIYTVTYSIRVEDQVGADPDLDPTCEKKTPDPGASKNNPDPTLLIKFTLNFILSISKSTVDPPHVKWGNSPFKLDTRNASKICS